VPVAPLDAAVWAEVCRVLADPARVLQEYQRRLDAVRMGAQPVELEMVERQLGKLRRGIGRLIDSYAEGIIDKAEFEPRIRELRQRLAKLEGDAAALKDAAEQTRSLHLVIGKLETFAEMVGDRLETADWDTRRTLIRTLVRRIEIDDEAVRVIFRIDPGPNDAGGSRRLLQHCPGRDRQVARTDLSGTRFTQRPPQIIPEPCRTARLQHIIQTERRDREIPMEPRGDRLSATEATAAQVKQQRSLAHAQRRPR